MQLNLDVHDEIIIDNFAGGGGASTGIELAIGRRVDVAINHDPLAIAMHRANHPETEHHCESVWDIDPRQVKPGRPIGLLWLSPDCKHFSKAKGGKPVEKKIRGLAWVALRWAAIRQPRVIMLENVEEFITWGPLITDENGNFRPCPKRKGREFNAFVNALRRHGYHVEWRELRACDFGAPTIRKRLFLIARRDGQPIVWPAPTHADPKKAKTLHLNPWRTAAEIIDWSLPCPSIFLTKEEGRAIGVNRPLVDATMRRIAKGVMRYVINAAKPFIVEHANASTARVMSIDDPLRTQCAQVKGGHFALVSPTLIQTGYGERAGQSPRAPGLDKPLGTVVAGGQKHALVSAFLAKHFTGVVGADLRDPTPTVTSVDHNSLVAANLIHMGHGEGKDGGKRFSHGIREVEVPLNTVTANGIPAGIVTSHLQRDFGKSIGSGSDEPIPTITAGGGHVAEVRAFLAVYYGVDQAPELKGPLPTVTARDRFGLVPVAGQDYEIADIGLRMLSPRELFGAQGFPSDYIIEYGLEEDGSQIKLTKSAQVRMCGNSVCPPLARALVAANVHELVIRRQA